MDESFNTSLAGKHLDAARTALRTLRRIAGEGPLVAQAEVLTRVRTALDELSQVGHLLGVGDGEPARVSCGSCGGMIMPTATLCSFCWQERFPDAA